MPMALLAATLLVIGRVSADHELTAARSCGISFFELVLPILGIAAALSFASLYINCSLAPQTKYRFNYKFIEIAKKQPITLLEEGQYIKNFDDMVIFIGKRHSRQQTLENIQVTRTRNHEIWQDIKAESGIVSSDQKQLKIKITLSNVRINERDADGHMQLDRTAAQYPLELDLTKLVDQRLAVQEIHHYPSGELWKQALELQAEGVRPTPILVELHKRVALALANISFVLIALPLGVQVRRRETSVGILISLVLAVFYYLLILLAESLKKSTSFYPEFMIWIPNLVFQGIGLYLLWRQNRV